MAARVLIPGGYGIFGRLLADELRKRTDAHLVIAGRSLEAAARACVPHRGRASAIELDLNDLDAVADAARGCDLVACCAGPFQALPRAVIDAATGAGAHWLDIADDRAWVLGALWDRITDERARAAGRGVLTGLSSVPLLALLLLRWGLARLPGADRADVTLFIGNRNDKGTGSVSSAITTGFHRPEPVDSPLGRRLAFAFDSPVEPLARELGVEARFRVALGYVLAGPVVAAASAVPRPLRESTARALTIASRPISSIGDARGAVVVALIRGTETETVSLVGDDQRFAILPLAIAAEELLAGKPAVGSIDASTWLEPEVWLERLCARGLKLMRRRTGSLME